MSDQELVLPMARAQLRLKMTHPRWWEWTLEAEDTTIVLGTESVESIGKRTLEQLIDGEPKWEYEGRQVAWVVALASPHCAIYRANDGPDRLLYFQDGNARITWRDRLTPDHLECWRAALAPICGYPMSGAEARG